MAKLTNIDRGPQGWVVRIVRDGVAHTKYFRFSDGGIRKSQARAIRWRDSKHRELGKRRWRKGPRSKAVNNSSGVTGVSKNVYGDGSRRGKKTVGNASKLLS